MNTDQLLITTEQLREIHEQPDVALLDVRYSLDSRQEGYDLFANGHIPGATYLHWLDDWSDPEDPVEGQLARPEQFAAAMRQAGVHNTTRVIAYDDAELFMAARMVWALNHYGHSSAQVLDGGLPKWIADGGRIETGPGTPAPEGTFSVPTTRSAARLTKDDVWALVSDGGGPLLACRMDRTWDETGQHIPGASRLPSPSLVRDDGTLRSAEEIRSILHTQGVTEDVPITLYCGGGVSAAQGWLAMRAAGFTNVGVYDGSWSEWSADANTPKASH